MDRPRVRGHYEHPISRWHIAARIEDPWHAGDHFLYRLPETLSINEDRYLWQPRGALCWPGVQPEAAPEWSLDDEERTTSYETRYYDGLVMSVAVRAEDDAVHFAYAIANGTDRTVCPATMSCFMIWAAPHFIDRRLQRTWVWVNGTAVPVRELTPTPEAMQRMPWVEIGVGRPHAREAEHPHVWAVSDAADDGLFCVESVNGRHCLGLVWAAAGKLMARSTIPCLHSEPVYPDVAPGLRVEVTGKLYFSDDGPQAIRDRFRRDLDDDVLRLRVI